MLDLAQYQIKGSTAREIAATAETSIRDGVIGPGDGLPTVRALARSLGTSPATVNSAYRILRQRGFVVSDGRRGTHVAPQPALRRPERATARSTRATATAGLRDLALGLPDPALLPPIGPAFERVDFEQKLMLGQLEHAADPDLLALARAAFEADGIPADAIAVLAGAFDAVERVLQAHLRPGDRVIVEDPAYVSVRDLLLALGLVEVPVPVDERGLVPDRFEAALEKGVAAVLIVPRAQNPYGSAMDAERATALRELIARHPDVLLMEDDHAGVVSGAPFSTLLSPAQRHWAVVRSTSKVVHPDLRLALTAGDETTISRVEGRQALGTRWVSHVLQGLVAELLRDDGFTATSEHARNVYTSRRLALIEALAAHGITAHGRSGLNVWVPVREEAPVVRGLHDAGFLVLEGERFRIHTPPGVRITISSLQAQEAVEIARIIAEAEQAGRWRRLY